MAKPNLKTNPWDAYTKRHGDYPSLRSGPVVLDEVFRLKPAGTAGEPADGEVAIALIAAVAGDIVYEQIDGTVGVIPAAQAGFYYPVTCSRVLTSGQDYLGNNYTTAASGPGQIHWWGGGNVSDE